MKNINYGFNNEHLQNIKKAFEKKTGVRLNNEEPNLPKERSFAPLKRLSPAVIAAVLVVCLAVTTALAVAVSNFIKLSSIVSPQTAEHLQPIEISTEYNGIKIEVIAALNDDEMAIVYLAVQDLTDNRIDKYIHLYNYDISGASGFTHEVVDYDETTKTAIIRMTATGGQDLNGKNVSLSVSSFLTGRKELDNFDTNINLEDITPAANTIKHDIRQSGSSSGGNDALFETMHAQGETDILALDEMNITLPNVGFAYISNIGIIDDKLHVQVKWTKKGFEVANMDDHGSFALVDNNNKTLLPIGIGFVKDDYYYSEFIFDIAPQTLANYKLVGEYFTTNGDYIEGDWKVDFKISSVKSTIKADCNIDIDGIKISNVSISPLGITLFVNGKKVDNSDVEISIPTLGSVGEKFSKFTDFSYNKKFVIKYISSEPLDIENIKTIYINDIAVTFHE